MARGDLQDLMLAVAVEGCPLDDWLVGFGGAAKHTLTACMSNNQFAAFVLKWKHDYKTTQLGLIARRVNMRLEFAARCAVNIEFVQLSLEWGQLDTG